MYVAGEVLVALDRMVSKSGKPFFTRAVWGRDFVLCLPASPETESQPFIHVGLQIQLAVVFSGCGGKIPQIIGVSGVEYGPVSGTEPS